MKPKVNIAEKFTLFSEHFTPKIIGEANIPALIGTETSSLYARNMVNFLEPMHDKESKALKLKRDDDMVKPTLIVDGGQVLYKKA